MGEDFSTEYIENKILIMQLFVLVAQNKQWYYKKKRYIVLNSIKVDFDCIIY